MALIVYLSHRGLFSLFAFIQLCQYFVISLGVFHIFLWSLSFRNSHWEIFYIGAKPIKIISVKVFYFNGSCRLQACNVTKTVLLHRYFFKIQLF